MNDNFGIRNITRVQKALQQLQRITPTQIQRISGEESLAQLRFKRLQNYRQKFNNKNTIQQQQPKGSVEQPGKKQQGHTSRWSIFKQVPVIAYKQSERKYQKQFINKINQFRKNIQKEQQQRWSQKQQQLQMQPNISEGETKKNIVTSLSDKALVTTFQKHAQQVLNKPSLFKPGANTYTNKNKSSDSDNDVVIIQQIPKPVVEQKPKNTGFVPNFTTNQTNSDIFKTKFQTPPVQPPPQIGPKSSLFSQSNPLAHVKPNIPIFNINNAPKINIFQNSSSTNNNPPPKPNIFQKKFDIPQPQPPKPLQVQGGLFSKSNPIAELPNSNTQKNKFINNLPNTSIFSQKKQQTIKITPKQTPQIQKKPTPPPENPQPTQPNVFAPNNSPWNKSTDNPVKTGIFTPNTGMFGNTPTTGLFGNMTTNSGLFGTNNNNNETKIGQQKNSGLFKNATISHNISPPNSLFTPTNSIFGNKDSKKEEQKQPQKNVFKNSPMSSLFSGKHQQAEKKSFFNLKPVQIQTQKPKQEQLTPKQQPKQEIKPVKKANQIFKDFANANPSNMFNKQPKQGAIGIFGKPLSEGNSIFSKTGGGGLFGNNNNSQQNIFQKKDNSVPLFGSKKEQEQQDDNQEEGQDVDIIQHKEETDPTKSTGNYKYQQTEVVYRQTVPKFKKGSSPIIQNVIISIQKVAGNSNYTLTVRLSNKCINFSGTILPGVTQVSKIKDEQYRNLSVKKIMTVVENSKPSLQLLKIQFRDEKQGQLFFSKMTLATKK